MEHQEALLLAKEALVKIESHENYCSKQNMVLLEELREIKTTIRGLYGRWWALAVASVAVCGGALAALIYALFWTYMNWGPGKTRESLVSCVEQLFFFWPV